MEKTMLSSVSAAVGEAESLFPFCSRGSCPSSSPRSANVYENSLSSKHLFWISGKKLPWPLQCSCPEVCWAWCGVCLVWLSGILFLLISNNITENSNQGCCLTSPSILSECLLGGAALPLLMAFSFCVDNKGSTAEWHLMGEWSNFEKLIYVLVFLLGYL